MPNTNFNPNARYDTGANAAGTGRASNQVTLQSAGTVGVGADGVVGNAEIRTGFHAAGVPRNNGGPNVAGAQKSINAT